MGAVVPATGDATLVIPVLPGAPRRDLALEISVEHPACVKSTVRVTVVPPPEGGVSPWTSDAEVQLTAAALARGRVLGFDGAAPEWAQVSLMRVGATEMDQVRAEPDGSFLLRSPEAGSFVVLARGPGSAPVGVAVALTLGRTAEVEPLRLTAGAVVEGNLTVDGRPAPSAEIEVRAEPWPAGAQHLFVGGQTFAWTDGSACLVQMTCTTDGSVSFRATGLGVGSHRLVPHLPGTARAPRLEGGPYPLVEAPSRGVRLALELAQLVIVVRGGARPYPGADVSVVGDDGGQIYHTAADGQAQVVVIRGGTYEVSAFPAGHSDHGTAKRVRVPENAPQVEVAFDLGAENLPGTVMWRCDPGMTTLPVNVIVRYAVVNEGPDQPVEGGATLNPRIDPSRTTLLAPGHYRVRAQADDGLERGWWTEVREAVEVRAGETQAVDLHFNGGGRLRLVARDAAGGFVAGQASIRTPEGAAVESDFQSPDGGSSHGATGRLDGNGPLLTRVALPTGGYEVVFVAPGFEAKTVRVTVVLGETRDVDVVLTPVK